jgi:pimeloyl-ACP methyl ester carboxylesterase
MATFVLLHPAWFGGWCWAKVTPGLRARGHQVLTPTLTGLGERHHLATREVGLGTHVEDIVNILEYEDLHDVILVGNSSGGLVITGVADRAPDRVANLVYLDAFVPEDGESLMDIVRPEIGATMKSLVENEGEGWLVPRIALPPWEQILKRWEITDERDVAWAARRLTPTPYRHFTEPVRRRNPAAEKLSKTYIRCRRWPNPGYDSYADAAKREKNWRSIAFDASHIPYISAPRETEEALLSLA